MKLPVRALGLIGLYGGLGGAINAWLCYVGIPARAGGDVTFSWTVIPAGATHGAILAVSAIGLSGFLSRYSLSHQVLGLLLVGWFCGWLSWIPLQLYVNLASFGGELLKPVNTSLLQSLMSAVGWPLRLKWSELYMPYLYFGCVALVYGAVIAARRRLTFERLRDSLLVGILSGSVGSLWWWSLWRPWYFSVLHGLIWGSFVGVAVWKTYGESSGATRSDTLI